MMAMLVLAVLALSVTSALGQGAGSGGIGVSADIVPVNFFQPKFPYNASVITTPFVGQLNTPYVCKTGANILGIDQYNAVLSLAPCNYITEHYHPEADEYNYMITGNLTYWILLGNGTRIQGFVPRFSELLLPKGLTHVILNDNCSPTSFFHFFPVANPLFIFTVPSVTSMPAAFVNSTFPGGLPKPNIPDGIHTVDTACAARCGINITTTFNNVTGPYATAKGGFCAALNSVLLAPNVTGTGSGDY